MFTGLIDDVGTIASVASTDAGRELRVSCRYRDLVIGESVAVNGCCLTVRECGSGWFTTAAVVTTLGRTTIGTWTAGRHVNLERALRLGDRLGGHFVQGHVDGIGRVEGVAPRADVQLLDIAIPKGLAEFMVLRGSIAIDGVSLTINEQPAPAVVQLSLIDHTLRHTSLGSLTAGDEVHVEGDMIVKYLHRMATPYLDGARVPEPPY